MSKVTDIVSSLALPEAEKLGLKIWDVEYVREAGQWFLRIYIDKDGGVSINDCEALSRAVDPILDEADPIPDSYVFEVSSAGAERELKRPGDFEAYIGHKVEVRLYKPVNGSKAFVGDLAAYENGTVSISYNGDTLTFEKTQVAQVRLRVM